MPAGFKSAQQGLRDEAAACAVDMPVAVAALLSDMEPQRGDQRQRLPGPCHRDIEQPPLLLDQLRLARRELGRKIAIRYIQHVNGVPLLPLRGVHRRQHQVVLVEERIARAIAGSARRVQRQFGQESLARRIAAGDLFELFDIRLARFDGVVQALQLWPVPSPHGRDLALPAVVVEFRRRQRGE